MKIPFTRGFTLVELLVSISIFTLITVVSVFNYSDFNSSIELTNLAYDIALSVRQAQFYGITVKESSVAGNFNSGYGIHFDLSIPASQAGYVLFEDVDANHVFNTTAGDVTLGDFAIQKGNRIGKVCLQNSASDPCATGLTSADISFVRPNPESTIVMNGIVAQTYASAVICLASAKATYRAVTVTSTGQISVSTDAAVCN